MAKEKIMTFVQARPNLSEIVERVSEQERPTFSQSGKSRLVILGLDKYRQLTGKSKHM